ncbi:MAG: glycosyltransferase [Gammaproteobacteria bacterium]
MHTVLLAACLMSLGVWLLVLLAPWRPWSTRERFETDGTTDQQVDDVTVLIPARNEAESIGPTLAALVLNGRPPVIVIDDESTDETATVVASTGIESLCLVSGTPTPAGWSGKLWALEQGIGRVRTSYVLLLDADIVLSPGTLQSLRRKLINEDLGLVSLLAELHMAGFWERLLMPVFVFFFKLLYPFAVSNSDTQTIAAAAGGCMLVRRDALEGVHAFSSIREALIDDCTLARALKRTSHRTWVGLTRSAISQRAYPRLVDIWNMVARTAYTQLRYSPLLLLLCTVSMVIVFWAPVAGLFFAETRVAALAGGITLMLAYIPTLRFYGRSLAWALTLPFSATLFLAMTWTSAMRDWRGRRSYWKDRIYKRGEI